MTMACVEDTPAWQPHTKNIIHHVDEVEVEVEDDGVANNNDDEPERVTVRIPNMFVSFLAEQPRVNPNYDWVRPQAEAWFSDFCSFDKRMSGLLTKADASYFVAVVAPDAAPKEFRTMCDWMNWVFPYDDIFDEGELRDKPEAAAEVMASLMRPMAEALKGGEGKVSVPLQSSSEKRPPLVRLHDTIWERLQERCTRGALRRYAQAMARYCAGALIHVEDFASNVAPTPEEMLAKRQLSSGVYPLFQLVEYAHALRIPDRVFEHWTIRELEELGSDIVAIINDLMSYIKEEADAVPHNLVAAARIGGLSAQEAFDYVGGMLDSRFERWERAVAQVPSWGNDVVDEHVRMYIDGVANTVRANLNWR
ncbi:isoprenoid synthase domain-containing protein [Xylariaceae sp. FL0594]|nr:isoprenoid synthase domain-containing protein [Xylariaceae sp. FL0594]